MGMDQYLSIPFLGEWTSINPSYFDVNYRGTRFWHTVIWYYMQQNPTYLPTPKTTSTQRFFLIWHLSPIPTAPAGEHGGALGVALWPRCLRFARGPGSWSSQKVERWWLGTKDWGKIVWRKWGISYLNNKSGDWSKKNETLAIKSRTFTARMVVWNKTPRAQLRIGQVWGNTATKQEGQVIFGWSDPASSIPNLSAVHIPVLLAWCSITIPPILLVVINPDVLSTPKNPHVTPCPHD